MNNYYTLVTDVARQKLAQAVTSGELLSLQYIAVGDGGGIDNDISENATALVNEQYRGALSDTTVDPVFADRVLIEGHIPKQVGGFYVREVGIYDADGDLFAIAKYPETYKATVDENTATTMIIRLVLEVSQTAVATIDITEDALATHAYVQDELTSIENTIVESLSGGLNIDYDSVTRQFSTPTSMAVDQLTAASNGDITVSDNVALLGDLSVTGTSIMPALKTTEVLAGDALGLQFKNSLGNDVCTMADNGYVGVGVNTPLSQLDIAGSFGCRHVVVSDNYSAADEVVILVDASSAPVTLTLPEAGSVANRQYYVKKIDATNNPVIVSSASNIDGLADYKLFNVNHSVSFLSAGPVLGVYAWYTLSSYQGYGQNFQYASENTLLTTQNSANFLTALNLQTNELMQGTYRISWSFIWALNATNMDVVVQILLNSQVISLYQEEGPDAQTNTSHLEPGENTPNEFDTLIGTDQRILVTGHLYRDLTGAQLFEMQFKPSAGSTMTTLLERNLEVVRVA